MPHSEAVRSIVEEALKPGVSAEDLIAGQYEVRGDGRINQPIYIDMDAYNNPDWPYRGSVEMIISRVDLQAALGHLGLTYRTPTPEYSAADIVAYIAPLLQLHFDPTDYINASQVLAGPPEAFTLRAAPDSPRWRGQVDVIVHR